MPRFLCCLVIFLGPVIAFSQDLKFELLTTWESLTPSLPISFGNKTNAIDLFNVGDFNNDGIQDIGFKKSSTTIIWEKTLGGSGLEQANSIQQTSDGGFIIVGYTESLDGDVSDGNSGGRDFWIIKLDGFGNKIWDKTFGGSSLDDASSIQQTVDGGYIVAGHTLSNDGDISDGNNGGGDCWIIKLDGFGNKIWDKTFGGSALDRVNSIKQTSRGGYIFIGGTESNDGDLSSPSMGLSDYWIVKLDSVGNITGDRTLGGSGVDMASSLDQTSDGGYIIAGSIVHISGGLINGDISDGYANNMYQDCWIVKLDSLGNKIWDKTFGGSSSDHANSIIQTSDGGYLFAGYTSSGDGDITDGNNGESDCWVVKLDNLGNKIWDKTFGGSASDRATSIQETSDGGFILSGMTFSNDGDISDGNNGGRDCWIIKLDLNGNKVWDKTFGGSDADETASIQQTSDGNYIIAGLTQSNNGDINDGNNGNSDYWVVKLDGSKTSYDSLYILTLNNSGTINNITPLVPGVRGFNYSGKRNSGWGGFGAGLVNMGDMDGDGIDDFLVSSPKEELNDSIHGAFFVLFMNSNGSVKDFHIVNKSEISNSGNNDYFAYSMVSVGDLDRDGINEVALNTEQLGGVYVLFFNPDGSVKKWSLNTLFSFSQTNTIDFYSNTGTYALENAGDLDSNGVDDILIDHFELGISILYLNNQGSAIELKQISKENPEIKGNGNYFGKTLSSIIDINNDGNNEIITQFSTSTFDTVPLFTTGIISYNDSFSVSNFQLINPYDINGVNLDVGSGESFGNRSIYLGDINNDGYPEIGILDMLKKNSGGNNGLVYIVSIKPADCDGVECVWPGDANSDGVANCRDVLSIGRGFNRVKNENKRILPVNNWIAQKANNWGELNNNIDMKFADCDGNGVVNNDDINAINQNYNLTHQKTNTIKFDNKGPLLSIVPAKQNVSQNETVQFDVLLGDSIKNAEKVFGLNMKFSPSSPELYNTNIEVEYSNSWIGNIDSNAIHLEQYLSDGISFAIARTDHQNATNKGKIASIQIPLNSNIKIDKFTLEVTELNIESYEGSNILVSDVISDSVSVIDSATINASLNSISKVASYPNPSSGLVYFELIDEISSVNIFSSIGVLIKTETVNANSFTLNLSSLTDGTYFIALKGKKQSYQSRITLKK